MNLTSTQRGIIARQIREEEEEKRRHRLKLGKDGNATPSIRERLNMAPRKPITE